ncbi:MAG: DNA polymerase IV [Anaerolineae bacterium]
MTRKILHVDLDCFYVSVERLQDPSLAGKPVLVGGDPKGRGVVASASYEAREFGVRSAMPTAQALRLCPDAIVIRWRHGLYREYSRQVMDILYEITPVVEQMSIDEAYLDVTSIGENWTIAEEIATRTQRRLKDELGLPSSWGVATNKLVAKIASDQDKPAGLVVVPPGTEADFLAPLPVEALWGVGPVTGEKLRKMGASTIGELAQLDAGLLERTFGVHGLNLARRSRGIDNRPVVTERVRKSVSQENTFSRDVSDRDKLVAEIQEQSASVARSLQKNGQRARTITLKLRRPDFSTVTRSRTIDGATDDAGTIANIAVDLFDKEWHRGEPVRLIGVRAGNLVDQAVVQLSLFDQADRRLGQLEDAVAEIRARFGDDVIHRGPVDG